jgi:hypothetical protein
MLRNNRPRDRKKSRSTRFARKLRLGAYMKERKVARNKMMRDARRFV